jgi:putative NADH-flavin reductase
MKLVVFGATGGTGTKVVERALSAGHDVVAVARRPEAVPPRDRLVIVQCDVLEAPAVAAAMSGGDAVIATIGPASNRKPGTLISAGVRNLLTGCVAGGTAQPTDSIASGR